jgi:hypothetical protein
MPLFHFSLPRATVAAAILCILTASAAAQRLFIWGEVYHAEIPPGVYYFGGKSASIGMLTFYDLTPQGMVIGWGDNTYGGRDYPSEVGWGVSAMSAGVFHGLALNEGKVIAWGWSNHGETNVPLEAQSGVTGIAAGEEFSLAIKDGAVIGWGSNDFGGLNIPAEASSGVQAIAASSFHALALKGGCVLAWGNGGAYMTTVPSEAQSGVIAIAAGFSHSLALKSDGSVVAWGSNQFGKCDVPSAAMSGVVGISAGYQSSYALKADGTLIGWGDNSYGVMNVPSYAHHLVMVEAARWGSETIGIQAAAWATLDQSEVFAGQSGTGTVTLWNSAGPGGVAVNLSVNVGSVHVPATVFVPEGASSAPFSIDSDAMFGPPVSAQIRASVDGSATVAATLLLRGSSMPLSLSRSSVVGGSTSKVTGSLTLPAALGSPLTVSLASSDSSASVPATVVIPAGSTTAQFTVSHSLVSSTHPLTISASYPGSGTSTAPISLLPVTGSILFDRGTVTSGESVGAYVYLNTALKEPISVPLSSDLPGSISLPATATIYAGSRIGSFSVSSSAIGQKKTVVLTALVGGNLLTGTLQLLPVPWVASVALPTTLYGHCTATGTVRLLLAAPSSGVSVNLAAGSGLNVPATVFIAAGQTSATFQATASDVSASTAVTVTASNSVSSASRAMTIKPVLPGSVSFAPTTVIGGTTLTGTVTINATVAVDTVVSLSTGNTRASVPASVTVLAGSNSATFPIVTQPLTGAATSVLIRASKNGKTVSLRLYITP